MRAWTPSAKIEWAADIENAQEVSLLGTASVLPWAELLAGEGLRPIVREGQAQIMLGAAAGRFMGVSFRELSVSVESQPEAAVPGSAGFYLAQAWNSVWLFALAERWLFKTPYYPARVSIHCGLPAHLGMAGGGAELHACMAADNSERPGSSSVAEDWQFPIYLPSNRNGSRLFVARLSGLTQRFAWANEDRFEVNPSVETPALELLRASGWTPKQWLIRQEARHAKSKTYARSRGPGA